MVKSTGSKSKKNGEKDSRSKSARKRSGQKNYMSKTTRALLGRAATPAPLLSSYSQSAKEDSTELTAKPCEGQLTLPWTATDSSEKTDSQMPTPVETYWTDGCLKGTKDSDRIRLILGIDERHRRAVAQVDKDLDVRRVLPDCKMIAKHSKTHRYSVVFYNEREKMWLQYHIPALEVSTKFSEASKNRPKYAKKFENMRLFR